MFKENYLREMQQITPDSSFLQELAGKMEQEAEKSRAEKENLQLHGKGRAGKLLKWVPVAAAALICIGIGVFWKTTPELATANDNLMKQTAGGMLEQTDNSEGVFDGNSWYGSETDQAEIYRILTEKMVKDSGLNITVSKADDFQDAEALSHEDTASVVEMLEEGCLVGSYTDAKELLSGSSVYYLAEFQDGTVVKFAVYQEQYFYCSEIDGIFEFKN